MKQLILAILFVTGMRAADAATVDTATVHSDIVNKNIRCVIITPSSYNSKSNFPVVYLLHGYSGNYSDWVTNVPAIKQYADQDSIIIVCPDGNYSSWYFDAPMDSTMRYETFVSKELITYVDAHYKTIKERSGRGIAGLSMGGHGAFYLAFKRQDVFGTAGSMSGGVDIRPYPLNWQISSLLGTYKEHPENWKSTQILISCIC